MIRSSASDAKSLLTKLRNPLFLTEHAIRNHSDHNQAFKPAKPVLVPVHLLRQLTLTNPPCRGLGSENFDIVSFGTTGNEAMAYVTRQRLEPTDRPLCEFIMTLNLSKTLLTAAFSLVASYMLATVSIADNGSKDKSVFTVVSGVSSKGSASGDWGRGHGRSLGNHGGNVGAL